MWFNCVQNGKFHKAMSNKESGLFRRKAGACFISNILTM